MGSRLSHLQCSAIAASVQCRADSAIAGLLVAAGEAPHTAGQRLQPLRHPWAPPLVPQRSTKLNINSGGSCSAKLNCGVWLRAPANTADDPAAFSVALADTRAGAARRAASAAACWLMSRNYVTDE